MRHLSDIRVGVTTKVTMGNLDMYVTVNFFDDDGDENKRADPAEIFIKIGKIGSDLFGLLEGLGMVMSLGLRSGAEWQTIRENFIDTKFGGIEHSEYSSILAALATGVDRCIAFRADAIGIPNRHI